MNSIYFTTPIYYVNAEPHLGHAYTSILADVLTRFHRQRGVRARFLTGTDEHGERIEQSAQKQGLTPQQFVDRVSQKFRDMMPPLEVCPDDFIRTTEARHKEIVIDVLTRLFQAGEIYKGEYRGLYCTGCERFLTEKELVEGKCPDHKVAPRELVEENYLFRMEKHREWLRSEIERRPDWIQPERYRNEVLAMLREPIGDLSISRPMNRVSWGIPLPFDPDHVLYVWFDALFNYATALGRPGSELFDTYWPVAVHLMAKDIVKPHGIFWPIMLKAAGYPLFKGLRVHGYWLVDATKMSKSLGNVVRPHLMVERYGADAFRYYLMRDMVFGQDADFSELALANRSNSDLANDLGNLLSRVHNMIGRYCDGRIPEPADYGPLEEGLRSTLELLPERVDELFGQMHIHAAIEEILQGVRKANQYVQESAPWAAAKDPSKMGQVRTVLYHAAETLRLAAVLLYPIIPAKSVELLRQLGVTELETHSGPAWERAWGRLPSGLTVAPGEVLFPRIDIKALMKEFAGAELPVAAPIVEKGTGKGKAAGEVKAAGVGAPAKAAGGGGLEAAVPAPAPVAPATAGEVGGLEGGFISIDDFAKVQLRVAEVVHAEPVPKAKKLLKLTLKLGDSERTVVSGIAEHYQPDQLIGKKVVVVANLRPVVLRGVESQGMILAAEDSEGHLSLVSLDRDLPSGGLVK